MPPSLWSVKETTNPLENPFKLFDGVPLLSINLCDRSASIPLEIVPMLSDVLAKSKIFRPISQFSAQSEIFTFKLGFLRPNDE